MKKFGARYGFVIAFISAATVSLMGTAIVLIPNNNEENTSEWVNSDYIQTLNQEAEVERIATIADEEALKGFTIYKFSKMILNHQSFDNGLSSEEFSRIYTALKAGEIVALPSFNNKSDKYVLNMRLFLVPVSTVKEATNNESW